MNMAFRFIIGFVLLLVVLFFTFDFYSYGIDLKSTPLLVTNPLLVIQAHYAVGGGKELVRENCPEIYQFRKTSYYANYEDIPVAEWDKCIAAVAPSEAVRDACLEAEADADALLKGIYAQNELVLGLEKYGVKFTPLYTYERIADFADGNACTTAIASFSEERRVPIVFKPSALLDTNKFSLGVSETDRDQLLKITSQQFTADSALKDYRITIFLVIAGVFVFLIVVFSAYSRLREGDGKED